MLAHQMLDETCEDESKRVRVQSSITRDLAGSDATESQVVESSSEAVHEGRRHPALIAATDVHRELLQVCVDAVPRAVITLMLTNSEPWSLAG